MKMDRWSHSVKIALSVVVFLVTAAAMVQAQVANDDFDSAIPVDTLPSFTHSLDTVGATLAPDDPFPGCSWQTGPTVWYAITPGIDMWIAANTGGTDYSNSLSVWTGSRGSLTQVACGNFVTPIVVFHGVAGQTYYFMVSADIGAIGGTLVFSLTAGIPLENDDFDHARVITELPFTESLITLGATLAPDDPNPTCLCCGVGVDATVWYSITPATKMWIDARATGYPLTLSVWTGGRGSLTQVACGNVATLRVIFQAVAGETYYFMVSGNVHELGGGNLVFSANGSLPPENDDFDHATVISGLPFTDSLATFGATLAPDDPTQPCTRCGYTVWYSVTPETDMWIEANTGGSDYDSILSVWTGSRGSLVKVDSAFGFYQAIFQAVAGETYYFMVSANTYYGTPGGNLVFSVNGSLNPRNDDFDNAKPVSGLSFTDNLATFGATLSPDVPPPRVSAAGRVRVRRFGTLSRRGPICG